MHPLRYAIINHTKLYSDRRLQTVSMKYCHFFQLALVLAGISQRCRNKMFEFFLQLLWKRERERGGGPSWQVHEKLWCCPYLAWLSRCSHSAAGICLLSDTWPVERSISRWTPVLLLTIISASYLILKKFTM